jgi:hypothetical protein
MELGPYEGRSVRSAPIRSIRVHPRLRGRPYGPGGAEPDDDDAN